MSWLYDSWKRGFQDVFHQRYDYFVDSIDGLPTNVDLTQNESADLQLDKINDRELSEIKASFATLTSLLTLENPQEDTERRIKDTMADFKAKLDAYLAVPRSPKNQSFRTVQRMASRLEQFEDLVEYTTNEDSLLNVDEVTDELNVLREDLLPYRYENAYDEANRANDELETAIQENKVLKAEGFHTLSEDPDFQIHFVSLDPEGKIPYLVKEVYVASEKYNYAIKQHEIIDQVAKQLTDVAGEIVKKYQALENSKEMLETADPKIKDSLHEVENLDNAYLNGNKVSAMIYKKGQSESAETRRIMQEIADLQKLHDRYQQQLDELNQDLIQKMNGAYSGRESEEDFADRTKDLTVRDYDVKENIAEKEQELANKRIENQDADARFENLQNGYKKSCEFIASNHENIKNKVDAELKSQKTFILGVKKDLEETRALQSKVNADVKKYGKILTEVKPLIDKYNARYPKVPGNEVVDKLSRVNDIHNQLSEKAIDASVRSDAMKERMKKKFERWYTRFQKVSGEKRFGNTDEFKFMKNAAEELDKIFNNPAASGETIEYAFDELVVRAQNYSTLKGKAKRGTDLGQMRIDLAHEIIENEDTYRDALRQIDSLPSHYSRVKEYATTISENTDIESCVATLEDHKMTFNEVVTDKKKLPELKVYANKKFEYADFKAPTYEMKDKELQSLVEVNGKEDFDKEKSAKIYANNVENLLENELYKVGEKQQFADEKIKTAKVEADKKVHEKKVKRERTEKNLSTSNAEKKKNGIRKI